MVTSNKIVRIAFVVFNVKMKIMTQTIMLVLLNFALGFNMIVLCSWLSVHNSFGLGM